MTDKYMYPGSSCAGVVAAGIAGFFIGFVILISTILDAIDPFPASVGSSNFFLLAVRVSIIIWMGGWYILHVYWRKREVKRKLAHKVASILILLGLTSTLVSIISYAVR